MSGARAALAGLMLAGCCAASFAGTASARFCDREAPLSATEQDRLLRFAAVARDALEASGAAVALVARSGLDLSRFSIRYSHAGFALRDSANGPWSVRQLYYACDEGRPRLYDQGLAGFLFGTDDPRVGYFSILLLPREAADALQRAALDNALALRLLAATYSANAHPDSLRYQNCNQWAAELMAAAWAPLADGPGLRSSAQRWLGEQGYAPEPVDVGAHWLMAAMPLVPWLHLDDHPEADRYALRVRTSLPSSLEAFALSRYPGARRIELCHDTHQVVVRRGGPPIGDGCRAGPGDEVHPLD